VSERPDKTTDGSDLITATFPVAAVPPRSPGLERLGEFRILGMIGRCGMGVVHRAEQKSLERKAGSTFCRRVRFLLPGRF
jgi:hypothetical protein